MKTERRRKKKRTTRPSSEPGNCLEMCLRIRPVKLHGRENGTDPADSFH